MAFLLKEMVSKTMLLKAGLVLSSIGAVGSLGSLAYHLYRIPDLREEVEEASISFQNEVKDYNYKLETLENMIGSGKYTSGEIANFSEVLQEQRLILEGYRKTALATYGKFLDFHDAAKYSVYGILSFPCAACLCLWGLTRKKEDQL